MTDYPSTISNGVTTTQEYYELYQQSRQYGETVNQSANTVSSALNGYQQYTQLANYLQQNNGGSTYVSISSLPQQYQQIATVIDNHRWEGTFMYDGWYPVLNSGNLFADEMRQYYQDVIQPQQQSR